MKKSIMILMLVTTGFFCFGQSSRDSVYVGKSTTDSVYTGTLDSVKAKVVIGPEPNGPTKVGLAKAIETGTIYNSTSPYHNVLHEFTNLVAMRDYCNKTLSQMRDNGESDSYRMNKKLSKKLKRELTKAKAELASAKFNGLKIESDYYELFLKQISDRFKD
jgi:hypothetical protein